MADQFGGIYQGKTVLVTGHTGFKGSWLSLWLKSLGANVVGFSLDEPSDPCHHKLLGLEMVSIVGDVRNPAHLEAAMRKHKPAAVFHLAAQALVRRSYAQPMETFQTNVMGTLNVLEACRNEPSVKAVLVITSDKVYDNQEWAWGYRENDKLGGYDPYSASKACAEIALASFRNAFLNPKDYGTKHNLLVSSVRAGNVIGGGDWALDRLIPDIVRAASKRETVIIRNPGATRPWQHVLECLAGYLMVGQRLLEGWSEFAREWNFGPSETGILSVGDVVVQVKQYWPEFNYEIRRQEGDPHEAYALTLDSSLARIKLGWRPVWSGSRQAFMKTIAWYQQYYTRGTLLSAQDLAEYVQDAQDMGLPWAK
ncbi:MAG: CDP-glucose 4,6-dehydratase [Fibrobacteres bacterium]|nr:CDP-glucose 4,6-dehydratase [Fibrobacterota bacterium]